MSSASWKICMMVFASLAIAGQSGAQDSEVNDKGIQSPAAGIFKLPNLNLKIFEVRDESRPRIGWVIELTAEDEAALAHNFKYCDGTTARVQLSELIESTKRCGQDKFGGTLNFSSLPLGSPVYVFAGEARVDGRIVSLQPSKSGGYVGIVEFANGAQFSNLVKVQSNMGELLFPSGIDATYTEADREILKQQWMSNSTNSDFSQPQLVDFGVGSVVGVASIPDPDTTSISETEIGLSFSF
jgi:hypothetical protein